MLLSRNASIAVFNCYLVLGGKKKKENKKNPYFVLFLFPESLSSSLELQ